MRSDVTQFDLSAPPSLDAVLAQLAAEPGKHTPIAGGTELMVALNTGRLTQHSLVSIHHLKELRFIRAEKDAIHIGSGATFTDIRNDTEIAAYLPLLIQSASWTGTIANQNRATLGGNICNASPAADTPPALLAYGATITLISAAGKRTLPYIDFHLSYKKTVLRPNELVHSVTVPRDFPAIASTSARSGRAMRWPSPRLRLPACPDSMETRSPTFVSAQPRSQTGQFDVPPPKLRCWASLLDQSTSTPLSVPGAQRWPPRPTPSTTYAPPPNTAPPSPGTCWRSSCARSPPSPLSSFQ